MFHWTLTTTVLAAMLISISTWLTAPWIGRPVSALAESHYRDVLAMNLTVDGDFNHGSPADSNATTQVSLSPQPLRYDPTWNKWSFGGNVLEIRQVYVMGLPAQIALVQSRDFEAWVILRMNSQSSELPEIVLGQAIVGDQVRVSISGPHVSKNGVDWNLCQPIYSNYCRQGGLYDIGPIATDWNMPLSPSNEFIHWGHANPSTEYPLFWNSQVLKQAHRSGLYTGGAHSCAAARIGRQAGQTLGQICFEPR